MVIEINKKTARSVIDAALVKLQPGKRFNAKKHCGKVKFGVDSVKYQKQLRDEWD